MSALFASPRGMYCVPVPFRNALSSSTLVLRMRSSAIQPSRFTPLVLSNVFETGMSAASFFARILTSPNVGCVFPAGLASPIHEARELESMRGIERFPFTSGTRRIFNLSSNVFATSASMYSPLKARGTVKPPSEGVPALRAFCSSTLCSPLENGNDFFASSTIAFGSTCMML